MPAVQTEDPKLDEAPTKSIEEILVESGELAALPQVILKLIDLTADPKVCAADVERVIQTDQAVTARVLTLANSSYYGLPRRISSVREAVVFLGFKSVRSLAMAVTAFNMFLGKSDNASLTRRDLWKHSLNTALCTRVIYKSLKPTEASKVDPDEAFTAALLHDMGKMALETALPQQFESAIQAARKSGFRMHEIECDFLPFSHAVIGSAMADRWSLPESLCDTVLNHHTPLDSQVSAEATAVVALADEIAQGLFDNVSLPEDKEGPEAVSDAATILKFSSEEITAINDACKIEIEKGVALS